jgi:hypothetical protein
MKLFASAFNAPLWHDLCNENLNAMLDIVAISHRNSASIAQYGRASGKEMHAL